MFHTIVSIAPICRQLHAEGKTIVLATGFFDFLHSEHLNFLRKAKAVGDILIVAVESDERARETKGEGRPIETQSIRCQHVLDLEHPAGPGPVGPSHLPTEPGPIGHIVDYVIALPSDFNNFASYDSLMSAVCPQIYAVSSHTSHQKTKDFLASKYGGKLLIVHDFNPAISTTKILNNLMV